MKKRKSPLLQTRRCGEITALIVVVFTLLFTARSAPAADQPLVWETLSKTNHVNMGEPSTTFDFIIRNNSSETNSIDDVHASCGCTVATMPSKPWLFKPGETSHLPILIDVRGKTGTVFKDIAIDSKTSPTKLQIAVVIEPGTNAMSKEEMDRLWGRQLAAVDRQGVFTRKECLGCHLVPAFGKSGQNLYNTACGICHEAEHRATMVPDLHALKAPIPPDYWRQWITHGKPGTLMPAFTAREGGPLNDAQITSLVTFLTKEFPRPLQTPGQGEDDLTD